MKKILLLGLVVLAIALVSACGGSSEPAETETEIGTSEAMFSLTQEEAQEVALEAYPGEVISVREDEVVAGEESDINLFVYVFTIETEAGETVEVKVAKATGWIME